MALKRIGGVLWILAGLVSFGLGSLEVPELYVRLVAALGALAVGAAVSRLRTAWSTGFGLAWVVLYVGLAAIRFGAAGQSGPDATFFWIEVLSAVLGAVATVLVWRGFGQRRRT